MKNPLLATFGIAMALTLSTATTAQMHHDNDPHHNNDTHHQTPPPKAPMMHKDTYGSWNNSWGARPGMAPKSWMKKGDWYRHVRACQRQYHGYTWNNDSYRVGKKWLRCKL